LLPCSGKFGKCEKEYGEVWVNTKLFRVCCTQRAICEDGKLIYVPLVLGRKGTLYNILCVLRLSKREGERRRMERVERRREGRREV
jgi:hypothetical protein